MCLWRHVFKRLRKQLSVEIEATTPDFSQIWFISTTVLFLIGSFLLKRLIVGHSIHHLNISTSERDEKRAFQWVQTPQILEVIIIIIPSPWLISLNLAGTQICSGPGWKMQPWKGHLCIRSSCSGFKQLVVLQPSCGRLIALEECTRTQSLSLAHWEASGHCQAPKPSIQMFVSPFPSETETIWFSPNSTVHLKLQKLVC